MKIHDLEKLPEPRTPITDPCTFYKGWPQGSSSEPKLLSERSQPKLLAEGESRSLLGGIARDGVTQVDRRIIIVPCEDQPGTAEYKWLYPDGHLGAVED